ncbi:hypothetical protein GYB22_03355 [bacterium]|nr:hypothetical protein [bacterium]
MKPKAFILLCIIFSSCAVIKQNGYYQSRKYRIKTPKIFQRQDSKKTIEDVVHFSAPQKIKSKDLNSSDIRPPGKFDSISLKQEVLYTTPSIQIDTPDPVSYDTALYRVKYHPLIIENTKFTLQTYGILLYFIIQTILFGTIYGPYIVVAPFIVYALYISTFRFFDGLCSLKWLAPSLKGRNLAIALIILNLLMMSIIMGGLILIYFVL